LEQKRRQAELQRLKDEEEKLGRKKIQAARFIQVE